MSVRESPPVGGIVRNRRFSRYDLYLALLPAPLVAGILAALLTSVPVPYGAGAGALPSALVLCYGLFRDAPRAGTTLDGRGAPTDD